MRKTLLFLWSAAADLALDGILGAVWFTVMVTLLSVGITSVPAFGAGVLVLAVAAPVGAALRSVERTRAAAVYGVAIPIPPRRRTTSTGFGGWIAQVFLDTFSAATWKGLAHHAVTLLLGSIFWLLITSTPDLLVLVYRGQLAVGVPGGVGGAVLAGLLALAVLVTYVAGAGALDRRLSVTLLGTSRTAALEERVDHLQDARQGAVDASAAERLRIERDLHDGVQPRLVSVAMTLGLARSKFESDPAGAKALLDEAHQATKESITDLRHLARGIHPAVLSDRGLDAALSAVAAHCTVPASVRVDLPTRPSSETEAMLYFVVSEALTNVSKHSRASGCSVSVTGSPTGVRAVVFDNGVGGAGAGKGGGVGLAGMADRVRSAGGTLTIDSPQGGPTVLTVEAPCAF